VAAAGGATLAGAPSWQSLLAAPGKTALEAALVARLPSYRWFAGKARTLRTVTIAEAIPLAAGAFLLLLDVGYEQGEVERYALPLAFAPEPPPSPVPAPGPTRGGAPGSGAGDFPRRSPRVVARLAAAGGAAGGVLYDPFDEPAFARALLQAIVAGRRFRGTAQEVVGWADAAFAELAGTDPSELEPRPLGAEQSNTSLRYGDRLVLKLFRKLEPGVNPDLEVGRFLTRATTFRHMPPVAGGLDVRDGGRGREPMTLAVLQGFVANEGDAWSFTLDALGRYFERVRTGWGRGDLGPAPVPEQPLLERVDALGGGVPQTELYERIGTYLPTVRLLGERTAELHIALASAPPGDAAFAPEPFSTLHQRSLYESMRTAAARTFQLLRQRLDDLGPEARAAAEAVLAAQDKVRERFALLLGPKVTATRIRTHGDYHLGQVLYTGKDFVILDFEGEPARPLSERRLKRSPLRDVAGMLRSFQYAAFARLFDEAANGLIQQPEMPLFESWSLYWERWVSAAFLAAYLERAGTASFVPARRAELAILLDAYVLEKAIYELAYELNNRPGWVRIPLAGIREILGLGESR
jgi:trehalose synthase-fused probable maltokinase